VIECRAEGNYTLWVKFDDGLEGLVYLGDLVTTHSYLALSDEDIFSRVEIDPVANVLMWTGGIRLEPDMLYRDLASKTLAVRH
jgi:hypothetical protein